MTLLVLDTRDGAPRRPVGTYRVSADAIDQIRVAVSLRIRQAIRWLDEPTGAYWAGELWATERACHELGIETDA